MTVASRLQTTLLQAMGLQSDLLAQAAQETDPDVQLLWREAAHEIATVASHLRERLRALVVAEPQYAKVEQIVDLWTGHDTRGEARHDPGPH